MDPKNTFCTPGTYNVMRLEYLVGLGVATYLFVANVGDVRWWVAILFFFYTDLIGYLPGAIAYRRSESKRISKVYYALYDTMHSIVTASAVVGLWCLAVGPEWALLASPIHIGIDRGIFGNFLKSLSVPFEPEPHPVWAEVKDSLTVPAPGAPGADVGADAPAPTAKVGSATS
jgi:hypothetical protein